MKKELRNNIFLISMLFVMMFGIFSVVADEDKMLTTAEPISSYVVTSENNSINLNDLDSQNQVLNQTEDIKMLNRSSDDVDDNDYDQYRYGNRELIKQVPITLSLKCVKSYALAKQMILNLTHGSMSRSEAIKRVLAQFKTNECYKQIEFALMPKNNPDFCKNVAKAVEVAAIKLTYLKDVNENNFRVRLKKSLHFDKSVFDRCKNEINVEIENSNRLFMKHMLKSYKQIKQRMRAQINGTHRNKTNSIVNRTYQYYNKRSFNRNKSLREALDLSKCRNLTAFLLKSKQSMSSEEFNQFMVKHFTHGELIECGRVMLKSLKNNSLMKNLLKRVIEQTAGTELRQQIKQVVENKLLLKNKVTVPQKQELIEKLKKEKSNRTKFIKQNFDNFYNALEHMIVKRINVLNKLYNKSQELDVELDLSSLTDALTMLQSAKQTKNVSLMKQVASVIRPVIKKRLYDYDYYQKILKQRLQKSKEIMYKVIEKMQSVVSDDQVKQELTELKTEVDNLTIKDGVMKILKMKVRLSKIYEQIKNQ